MPDIVLLHESQEEYDSLEGAILNRFKPADELEMDLVKEMAAARWRLRRIEAMEAALFKKAFREQGELQDSDAQPGDIRDTAYAGLAESKSMRMLIRNRNQLRRTFDKSWRNLESLRDLRVEQETQKFPNEPKGSELTPQMIEMLIPTPILHLDDAFSTGDIMRSGREDGVS
jgi:hypothetical protein